MLSFEVSRAKRPFQNQEIRLLFARTSDLAKLKKLPGVPEVFRERLAKKLDEAEKTLAKPLHDKARAGVMGFDFATTEGGRFGVRLVDEAFPLQEIHGALRKSCASFVAQSADFARVLDLETLPAGLADGVLRALVMLSHYEAYKAPRFGKGAVKTDATKPAPPSTIAVLSRLSPSQVKDAYYEARLLGEASTLVRELADLPGNELTPTIYRKKLEAYAKNEKFEFKFLDTKKLAQMGANAFLAVARADLDGGAGLAHLSHVPKKKPKKKLVLVGKGLCFDTGGYNIKVGSGMFGMQRDMTGSAVALASFRLLRELHPDFEIHALLGIAENLISPTAFRANDVVTAMNGTSIEVVDTDAEGRMVLADVLAYAAELKADLCLDYATLTGAAVRALGTRRGAIFTNREKLQNVAMQAGEAVGQPVWGFPLSVSYRKDLASDYADILQCSHGSHCDHIYAAHFLAEFMGTETPWIHLDLTASNHKGGLGLAGTDTTGYGVHWTLEVVRRILG